MAWRGCVVLVLLGVWWCIGVGGLAGVKEVNVGSESKSLSRVTPLANVLPSFTSCRRLKDLLRLLGSALDDLHALQEVPHAGVLLRREVVLGEAKGRAIQWTRKLHRRLLRLCPRQNTALPTPGSRASYKRWAAAAGDYLLDLALHGERPARSIPLRRQKLSHLLDIFLSLFLLPQQPTASTQPSHAPAGTRSEVEENGLSEHTVDKVDSSVVEDVQDDVVEVVVEVGLEEVLREVPSTFLSLALSPRLMQRGWLNFNTSSPRLLTLVGALAPAVLRVGGSAANFLTYDPTAPVAPAGGQHMDVEGDGGYQKDNMNKREAKGQREDEEGRHEERKGKQERNGKEKENCSDIQEERGDNQENRGKQDEVDGTKQDQCPRCHNRHFATPDFTNFTITHGDWTRLLHFTEAVDMQLLFDLNQFYREPEGSWDPSNARLLLRDACAAGFPSVTWQLGNEPNAYKHKFGVVLSGEQTARDYENLKKLLEEVCPSPVLLVGPDVTRPKHQHHHHPDGRPQRTYHLPHEHRRSNRSSRGDEGSSLVGIDSMGFLESFLSASTVNLTALTWHQYYVSGHVADVQDFTNPDVMDQLVWQVAQVVTVRDHQAPGRPIWLTESGSASGGGAPGLSDAFVAGFLWLDKLGVAAAGGVEVVARQTLYQACYALLDPDLTPNPDYWLSLLHKRVVGGRVLRLTMPAAPPTLRLYAHCLHPHAHAAADPSGGVVVLGMNLGSRPLRVSLGDQMAASPVLQYLLQPRNGDLRSRQVLLNGEELRVDPEGNLPPLSPVVRPPGPFTMPPASLGFWALPRAGAPACL